MSKEEPRLLIYFESEEHLVRRLGAAVVSCWEDLDHVARERLIERAKRVLDDEEDDGLDDHLERFITMHDGLANRSPA